jgi:hypothetical protein
MTKTERKFDPDWDLVMLIDANAHRYAVVKKPEQMPGYTPEGMKEEDVDPETLYVREGCIVFSDGRWFYFKFRKPMDYDDFKRGHLPFASYMPDGSPSFRDISDDPRFTPDFIFANRINNGRGTVGFPAPVFRARLEGDNNWIGFDDGMSPPLPEIVPDYVTREQLDDLTIAHMMLAEYLQEGVENPKNPKKAVR